MNNRFNICVITLPFQNMVGETTLSNFIDILEPLSNELFVITGKFPDRPKKGIHIIRLKGDDKKEFTLIRILKYLFKQVIITYNLIKIHKNIDIVIFHIGTRVYLLPVLTAKLLGKKTVSAFTGLMSPIVKMQYGKWLFGIVGIFSPFIIRMMEKANLSLADQVAVESESAIDFMRLNKYRNKITINGALYMDIDSFKIINNVQDRRDLIGYVGRLYEGKGIKNFVKAIPLLLKERDNLEFLIGGDGPLFDEIKNDLKTNRSYQEVELTGEIPHDKLPNYLNKLKLIILPSYSEGLPGIVQEGMACGTVVLATSVGGIPDLIKEGETGFIMKNNSPECITKTVIKALEHPNLDEIVENARKLIEDEYAYEAMVRKCSESLEELMKDK